MAERPEAYLTWPAEIRELFDRVLRAEATGDVDAGRAALDHLSGLVKQKEDSTLALAAAVATIEIATRNDPEFQKQLAARVQRETRGGVEVLEVAIKLAARAKTDDERRAAQELLDKAAAQVPPKGRA